MGPDYATHQHFNRYTYCYNNPLKYTDPTGHFGWSSIKKAVKKVADTGKKVVNNSKNTVQQVVDKSTEVVGNGVNLATKTAEQVTNAVESAVDFVKEEIVESITEKPKNIQNISDENNNEHKKGDVIKGVGQLGIGITLATAGGVCMFIGGTASITGIGIAPGIALAAVGGGLSTLGWEISRDAIHDLSGGEYGDPLTLGDLVDTAWSAVPLKIGPIPIITGYGPWGLSPSKVFNLP